MSHTPDDPHVRISSDALVAELLRERKKDRKASILKVAFFAVATLCYVLWMTYAMGGFSNFGPSKPFAAVVKITGAIGPDKEASYAAMAPLLKQAFEHPLSKGVVLNINSPGGTPVQSALIHDLVLELKEKHKKPVIAVGEDMMTSGAYLIAVSADTLVVNRSTVTGSIGVISAGFGFPDLLAKLGVERRVATAGKSKNLLDPFSPAKEEDAQTQQQLLTSIHEHFKDVVNAGRQGKLATNTPGLFEGSVWTGKEAVALGLVDELGSVDQAVKKHLGVEDTIVLARKKPVIESIMDMAGVKVSAAISAASAPPVSAIYPH